MEKYMTPARRGRASRLVHGMRRTAGLRVEADTQVSLLSPHGDISWLTPTPTEREGGTTVGSYIPAIFGSYIAIEQQIVDRGRAVDVFDVLAPILGRYTSDQSDCIFLVHGSWGSRISDVSGSYVQTNDGEQYLAVAGDIDQARELPVDPTICWPSDRSWLVVRVLDTSLALIGCDPQVADVILSGDHVSGLVIARVDLDDSIASYFVPK
jgi:hypothetical protein